MTNWKPKTHNLKLYIFVWNFKATELIFTYIYHSLASLSVLFKRKSLIFVNLTLLLHHVSIFSSESLYILPRPQTPVLKVRVFWCKTSIYCWNLSETLSLIYEDLLPVPLFAIWSISAPSVADSLRSLPSILNLIPGILGRSVNLKIPKRFLCRRPVFPDYLSVSCD